VQAGSRKQWNPDYFSHGQQELNLGAPEDVPLTTTVNEAIDHIEIRDSGTVGDDAPAELIKDDPVELSSVRRIGNRHRRAMCGQSLQIEALLDREG
jgi:hypothetical protein